MPPPLNARRTDAITDWRTDMSNTLCLPLLYHCCNITSCYVIPAWTKSQTHSSLNTKQIFSFILFKLLFHLFKDEHHHKNNKQYLQYFSYVHINYTYHVMHAYKYIYKNSEKRYWRPNIISDKGNSEKQRLTWESSEQNSNQTFCSSNLHTLLKSRKRPPSILGWR